MVNAPGYKAIHVVSENGIYGFFEDYRFLSNFHLHPVVYRGTVFPSNENAFQAAKFPQDEDRSFACLSPKGAKERGRSLKMSPDEVTEWNARRLDVMLELTRLKFSDPELKSRLLSTGNKYLEETNTWNDQFWGVCRGVGENHLGKTLMQVRKEIRDGTDRV